MLVARPVVPLLRDVGCDGEAGASEGRVIHRMKPVCRGEQRGDMRAQGIGERRLESFEPSTGRPSR